MKNLLRRVRLKLSFRTKETTLDYAFNVGTSTAAEIRFQNHENKASHKPAATTRGAAGISLHRPSGDWKQSIAELQSKKAT